MRTHLLLIPLLLLLQACGSTDPGPKWPTDLEGKKALLTQKREQLKALQQDIRRLEEEIAELNPEANHQARLVTLLRAERGDFHHFVEIQGNVVADDLVNVSPEASGRILELAVREGQAVKRGQLIARLDLEALEKQIAEVETALELAREVYERQQRLWDQNIGSEIQLLQAKNNKERLEKSLETLRVQLSKARVYAPISGIVEVVHVEQGELANPGMPLVTLLNNRRVKVVAEVPENYLKAIRKGQEVTVRFPALDAERKARISRIGSTINPANRTFSVEVELSNPEGLLKPNLLAVMVFEDYAQKDVVIIPIELVQQDLEGNDFVLVKGQGEKGPVARKVYVKTGGSYRGQIVIEEGLRGGEELIAEGARAIVPGEPIAVAQ